MKSHHHGIGTVEVTTTEADGATSSQMQDLYCVECDFSTTDGGVLADHVKRCRGKEAATAEIEVIDLDSVIGPDPDDEPSEDILEDAGDLPLPIPSPEPKEELPVLPLPMPSVEPATATAGRKNAFQCEQCPYSTGRKYNLGLHVNSVHLKVGKQFRCSMCPYRAARNVTLDKHVRIWHEKTKPGEYKPSAKPVEVSDNDDDDIIELPPPPNIEYRVLAETAKEKLSNTLVLAGPTGERLVLEEEQDYSTSTPAEAASTSSSWKPTLQIPRSRIVSLGKAPSGSVVSLWNPASSSSSSKPRKAVPASSKSNLPKPNPQKPPEAKNVNEVLSNNNEEDVEVIEWSSFGVDPGCSLEMEVTDEGEENMNLYYQEQPNEVSEEDGIEEVPSKKEPAAKVASSDARGMFMCQLCSYKTHLKAKLKRHVESNHIEGRKRFMYDRSIYVFDQVLNGMFRYRCEFCDYSSAHSNNLSAHVNGMHTKERKFSCNSCAFITYYEKDIRRHLANVHGGNKKV